NYNFGLSVPASAAGTVYLDMNSNSVMDAGDTGFANATLTLTGTTTAGNAVSFTTTTDANGNYIFASLTSRTYTIKLPNPGGVYIPEVSNVGTVNGAHIGTSSTPLKITQLQLTVGQSGLSYNFGGTYYSGSPS